MSRLLDLLCRAKKLHFRFGARRVFTRGVAFLYRKIIRRVIPTSGHLKRNGIPTGESEVSLGDRFVPPTFLPVHLQQYYPSFSVPGYEDALVQGLRQHVRRGDRIVIVGGGVGVTSTVAAKQAGSEGHVWIYEGSEEMTSITRRTLAINDVEDNTEVRHTIVGEAISVRGEKADDTALYMDPGDLPECEVLELDCEGAETAILKGMQLQPRSVLVESHGIYGAPSDEVEQILINKGYKIHFKKVAESKKRKRCIKNDIMVLFAVR